MSTKDKKAHWENIFKTRDTTKVSWHQAVPKTSLRLINELRLNKSDEIIEVGCGDSFLGDKLLDNGFTDITLLDISQKALDTIKNRLSDSKRNIQFINADITEFSTSKKYDLWHDRAVFHFLTNEIEIQKYIRIVSNSINKEGYLILGTFSTSGPDMCSDLPVKQYSEEKLFKLFNHDFNRVQCFTENHITPSSSSQNFLFCIFQRK